MTFILFGAYFPAWIVCALLGIAGAIGARLLMVASGMADVLPFQLLICVSAGIVIALAAWLLWLGH